MEVSINNQTGLDAILTVKINETDYREDFEKSLKDHGRKMKVPGFRPGKIPNGIVKKMIGKDVKRELVEKFLQKSIQDYLDTNNIKLVLSPLSTYHAEDIDWMATDLEFSYDIGLRPEINLDLKPLNKLTKYSVDLSEEDVAEDVSKLRRQAAKLEKAEFYDYSEDYYISVKFTELDENHEPVDGGLEKIKSFTFENIPQNLVALVEGQDDQFVSNIKIADIFTETEIATLFDVEPLNVKDLFPDFKLSVLSIMKANMPEMDQAFYNSYFPGDKVSSDVEFFAEWKIIMEQYYNSQAESILVKDMKKSLLEAMTSAQPEEFIKKYFRLSYEVNEDGEIEDYDKKYDAFREELKWLMLSEFIAEENKLDIVEEDVIHYTEDMIRNELGRSGYFDMDAKQLRQYAIDYLTKENNFNRTSLALRDGKVFDWLLKQIEPGTEKVSVKKFEELKNNQ